MDNSSMLDELLDQGYTIDCNKYCFEGRFVPRVTEILSSMDNQEYLLRWANSLGWKRKNVKTEQEFAAQIGTIVHNAIEEYLKSGTLINTTFIEDRNMEDKCINGFNSFIVWWNMINSGSTVEVISTEQELVGPFYGGTCDLLIRINGKIYLGDFKTSNHINYKYFLQLAAYREILRQQGIFVDGCFILQLSKQEFIFNEFLLSFDNIDHIKYIDQCLNTFNSWVYAYYHKLYNQQLYHQTFKGAK